jgi:hypothetical protein
MTETTFCRICEALCGLEVETEHGRVTAVRPDARHVATAGYACVKGLKQHQLYASPDRLQHPLRREGDAFARVSWGAALGEIGAKVRRIRDEHGPDAIAMYVGTAAGFGVLHPVFAQGFMTGLGSRSMFSSRPPAWRTSPASPSRSAPPRARATPPPGAASPPERAAVRCAGRPIRALSGPADTHPADRRAIRMPRAPRRTARAVLKGKTGGAP